MAILKRNTARFWAALATGLALSTPALGAIQEYSCKFSDLTKSGPVASVITLRFDSSNYFAFVQDEYTKQISSSPVRAEIVSLTSKKVTIKWRLVGISYRGSEHKVTGGVVDYKISIDRGSQKARITGVGREYYSRIYGKGRCKQTK